MDVSPMGPKVCLNFCVKNLVLYGETCFPQSTGAHALRAAQNNRFLLEVGWRLDPTELGLSRMVIQDITCSTQRLWLSLGAS